MTNEQRLQIIQTGEAMISGAQGKPIQVFCKQKWMDIHESNIEKTLTFTKQFPLYHGMPLRVKPEGKL